MTTLLLKNSPTSIGFISECPTQWFIINLSYIYIYLGRCTKTVFFHIITFGNNHSNFREVFKRCFDIVFLITCFLAWYWYFNGKVFLSYFVDVPFSFYICQQTFSFHFVIIWFGFSNYNRYPLKQLKHSFKIHCCLTHIVSFE